MMSTAKLERWLQFLRGSGSSAAGDAARMGELYKAFEASEAMCDVPAAAVVPAAAAAAPVPAELAFGHTGQAGVS